MRVGTSNYLKNDKNMKRNIIYLASAALILTAMQTSCANDDESISENKKAVVTATASVGNVTRMSYTSE